MTRNYFEELTCTACNKIYTVDFTPGADTRRECDCGHILWLARFGGVIVTKLSQEEWENKYPNIPYKIEFDHDLAIGLGMDKVSSITKGGSK